MARTAGFTAPCSLCSTHWSCQYHTDNKIRLNEGYPGQNPLRLTKQVSSWKNENRVWKQFSSQVRSDDLFHRGDWSSIMCTLTVLTIYSEISSKSQTCNECLGQDKLLGVVPTALCPAFALQDQNPAPLVSHTGSLFRLAPPAVQCLH